MVWRKSAFINQFARLGNYRYFCATAGICLNYTFSSDKKLQIYAFTNTDMNYRIKLFLII